MPELRECVAFFYIVFTWLTKATELGLCLRVLRLVVDAKDTVSEDDPDAIDETLLAPNRLPFALSADTPSILRGHQAKQYETYPPSLKRTDDNPDPHPISYYTLVSVDKTMRSLILEFKGEKGEELHLKLSYLTHTCVQVYTAAQWALILQTPKPLPKEKVKKRARIALAIEFETHTLAFVSNDLLFEPIWKERKAELPSIHLGVYDQDYLDWLVVVADWLDERQDDKQRYTRSAWEAVKSTQSVFMGVGVYTSSELFFDAGIPPWISEAELTDCPSRMARLCEALWCYAYRSFTDLNKLLSPAMAQGVLAPTIKNRLEYNKWLHVWAREYSHVPRRMEELVHGYYVSTLEELRAGPIWYRSETTDLYDIFDPYFIASALSVDFRKDSRGKVKADKPILLGDVIWPPPEWVTISGRPDTLPDNAVKAYYRRRGLLDAPNYLKPGHYTELGIRGIPAHLPSSSQVRVDTLAYYKRKQYWSVFRIFTNKSRLSRANNGPDFSGYQLLTGAKREKKYFKEIVSKTAGVAIGPLEYSASGTQARTTHGEKALHPLKAATREETIAFHRASRSACSSTASLLEPEEPENLDGDSTGESNSDNDSDGGNEPLPPRSESEFSDTLFSCYSENSEEEVMTSPNAGSSSLNVAVAVDASGSSLGRTGRATKRPLPADMFEGSDRDEDSGSDDHPQVMRRRSSRASKPKDGYAYTKRGYAMKKRK